MSPQSPSGSASASGREATPKAPQVEVRRSVRRRRTVSAYRDGERVIVLLPGHMSRTEERRWVTEMLQRLERTESRRRPTDSDLLERAGRLSRRYLGGRALPASVRWVTNQNFRWGSCTPAERTIRLSHRLQGLPSWVIDYVIIHELAHLLEPGHGPDFWVLVSAYPAHERARGYLEGVAAGRREALPSSEGDGKGTVSGSVDGEEIRPPAGLE